MNVVAFFKYLLDYRPGSDMRLAWIDYAKGIAIIMIVFRHVNTGFWDASIPLNPVFYDMAVQIGLTFRMPLYFLLSGIFFYRSFTKRGLLGYTIHKFNTIMYPYFIWGTMLMLLQMIFSKYVNGQFRTLGDFLTIFYDPWGHWWFLYALFAVSVLYMILFSLLRGNRYIVLSIGLVFYIISFFVGRFYVLDDILELFIFFAVGDLVAKNATRLQEFKWANRTDVWLATVVLAIVGELLLFGALRGNPVAILVFALSGSLAAALTCLRLSRSGNPAIQLLKLFGQHSLYIYLFHAFTAPAMRVFLWRFLGSENILILEVACFLSGVLGSIIVYRLIRYFIGDFLFVTPRAK